MKTKHLFILFFAISLMGSKGFAQKTSTSVFYRNEGNKQWLAWHDNQRALYKIISNEAFKQLDERTEHISGLTTKTDWEDHQKKVKSVLCASLAKFENTPLNAQTTGTLERETFIVEKVIFESHPGFYVTAALFLPKQRQSPAPAVIYCAGHADVGFRSETYQHILINLVSKGFIVLAFDPIGQGERLQYLDAASGKSKAGGPTVEHSYAGAQTLLTGTSLTDYFIWDGIRALDYLETRSEVDMKRIGVTGRSGGGTQTAQIAACDDRIYAAAPECYITNFKRLLQSIGPQDAEQNPYKAIAKGFDHPDYLHVRAPKPTLIITTTHDFFSIQGARETFAEVQKSYTALGKSENVQMVEDFGIHESTKNNREALYAFFQKHLNLPGSPTDTETTPFPAEELWVTPNGQVGTSYKCETVFSLNQKYFKGKTSTLVGLKENVARTAGITFERKLTAAVYTGKFSKDEVEVEKYFLENNRNDFALPVYVIKKEGLGRGNIVVWFHPGGKEKVLDDPNLTELVNLGHIIVSADLPGIGELHDPEFTGDGVVQGVPFNYTFGANLVGKSIPGIQAEAIDLLMQFIENDMRFLQKEKHALIQGLAASAFLHYGVLKKAFGKAAFMEFPEPNLSLVNKEYYDPMAAFTVAPGCLLNYDLTDLIGNISDSGVNVLLQKVNSGKPEKSQQNQKIIEFLRP